MVAYGVIFTIYVFYNLECVGGSCHTYTEGNENGYYVERTNRGVRKCVYIDSQQRTVEVAVNQTFRHTTDCQDCTCHFSGHLHCCGFGHHSGKYSLPKNCRLLRTSNCGYQMVLKADPTKPCSHSRTTSVTSAKHNNKIISDKLSSSTEIPSTPKTAESKSNSAEEVRHKTNTIFAFCAVSLIFLTVK